MRRPIASVLALAVVVVVVPAGSAVAYGITAARSAVDPFAAVDESMRARVRDDGLSGGVVYVARGGGVIHDAATGRVDDSTVIPIASASKWLTSATLMTLVDEGKLTLDTKVGDLLPGFRGAKKAVTVRHLLSHTSGLPFDSCIGDPGTTTAACTDDIAAGPDPETRPGRQFSYSGVGYEVVGRIIEVVTGQSFEEAFQARIARPLGMADTRFDEYAGQHFRHPAPSASAVSTVADYAKFLAMLAADGQVGTEAGGRVLSADSVREIERDQVEGIDTSADAAVQVTKIPTYGLGVWRDVVDRRDEAQVVSGNGAYGFYPWIDRAHGNYGIVGVADLQNGSEHAVPISQRQARMSWRAAAHWKP